MSSAKISKCNASGSALLEVMVSMIVLLVGVMGFVQLQHIGVKRTHDTRLREEGVKVVNHLAETMRAGAGSALPTGFYANPASLPPFIDCEINTCSDVQLMTYKMDILLREMVGFDALGARPAVQGWVPVNRVAVCVTYDAGTNPDIAQIDFLWKSPTDVNDLTAANCPLYGNQPVPGAGEEFSSISSIVNL